MPHGAEYENGAAPASPTREYIYSGSQLLAKIEGNATQYFHQDHLSNRVVTDASGAVVEQKGHYPFGEAWYEGATPGKLKFTSYERDSESGNDYAMFRYHLNRLGRFNAPDPIAGSIVDPQSLNRYAYVRNDPLNLIDPLGLCVGDDISRVTPDPQKGGGGRGGDTGGSDKKKRDVIDAALKQKNLAKCLNEFFGPGTILTNDNLPRIDASRDLSGGQVGGIDPNQVPETGRGTVQIDRGIFTSLRANDPFLVGTYLHETANALAIQRFTGVQPRAARALRGPRGGPPTEDQRKEARQSFGDPDIGNQFEKCLHDRD